MISVERIKDIVESQDLVFLGALNLQQQGEDFSYFQEWIDERMNAGMSYLERNFDYRRDPRLLLNDAKFAIIIGLNYYHRDSFNTDGSKIAQFAKARDYHLVIKEKGKRIISRLNEIANKKDFKARVFVDSAPILERALAVKTGSGFIGKNTCFIHSTFGSFLALGEIFLDIDIEVNEKKVTTNNCGNCRMCINSCPTKALSKEFFLDANKCLSYWSIEYKGVVPTAVWPAFKNYFFGCDMCQLVCPKNNNIEQGKIASREFPPLEEMALMNSLDFENVFSETPLIRSGIITIKRNALIALAASFSLLTQKIICAFESEESEVLQKTAVQAKKYLSEPG